MKFRNTLLAASMLAAPLLALPTLAQAQPVSGLYVGAGVGYNIMQNTHVDSVSGPSGTARVGGANLSFDGGFVGVGSVGYGLGNGLRLELQGDYYNNGIHRLSGFGTKIPARGTEQKYGVMVNALYDFDIGMPYLYPYVGVGIGYQWANIRGLGVEGVNVVNNQTKGAFAYQAIVGAAVPLPAIPGLSLTAEYRFMGIATDRNYTTVEGGKAKLGEEFNHSFLVGLRYAFNVAPPPPPPAPAPVAAPAPAPARIYLVFFDWDKSDLTTRARQIISEAAQNSTHVKYTAIDVNGYTDTSGTPAYNMGLSLRRANTVAAELVRDGVPRNVIAIKGFGETHLLVPTGPGVREPQNRRVEIIIQ